MKHTHWHIYKKGGTVEKDKVLNSISLFETGLSAAEWVWRIFTLLFIGGSGALTGLLAKADPILKQLGPIYWVIIGIITSTLVSLILYLIKSSILRQAQAEYHSSLATPKNSVNPLLDSFNDTIVPLEDLRLPTVQLHEHKHFKRCKFVGPGAVAIMGGSYVNSGFIECGDVIALPGNVMLTGIIVFKNCTVDDCEFIRTTIFVDQNTARGFENVPGINVKGLI